MLGQVEREGEEERRKKKEQTEATVHHRWKKLFALDSKETKQSKRKPTVRQGTREKTSRRGLATRQLQFSKLQFSLDYGNLPKLRLQKLFHACSDRM